MRKIVKNIINIIISFIMIFLIVLILATNILNTKILNKEYILAKMDETEFYLQVSREIQSGFENYIYQSGLPEETIQNITSDEIIKKDINQIINYIYEDTDISLSSEEVKQNLDNKIQEYIKSQNLMLNEQGRNNIEKFENLIIEEYNKNVQISSTFYFTANSILSLLNEISIKISNYPIIAIAILIVILIIVNRKNLLTAINFLGISLLSTGVLLKLGIIIITKNIDIDNLVIISTSLSNLIINILKENIYLISDNSNLFIICGLVAIISSALFKNVNEKENIEEKPKRRNKGKREK